MDDTALSHGATVTTVLLVLCVGVGDEAVWAGEAPIERLATLVFCAFAVLALYRPGLRDRNGIG